MGKYVRMFKKGRLRIWIRKKHQKEYAYVC